MKYRIALVTVTLVLVLTGCFQTETWTTIDANQALERKVSIQIDLSNQNQLLDRKMLFQEAGWTIEEDTITVEVDGQEERKYHLVLSKHFDHVHQFRAPLKDSKIIFLEAKEHFEFTEIFYAKQSAGIEDTTRNVMGWEDLKYTFHLTVPGKILRTNASYQAEQNLTWTFDYNDVFTQGTFEMKVEYQPAGEIGICGSTAVIGSLLLGLLLYLIQWLVGLLSERSSRVVHPLTPAEATPTRRRDSQG